VFPFGLPVARVTRVTRDPTQPLAQIQAVPLAQIDAAREVLFIWSRLDHPAAPASPAALAVEAPKPAPKPAAPKRPAPKPATTAPAAAPTTPPATSPATSPESSTEPSPATPPVETPAPSEPAAPQPDVDPAGTT
jgi:hypothetical protein